MDWSESPPNDDGVELVTSREPRAQLSIRAGFGGAGVLTLALRCWRGRDEGIGVSVSVNGEPNGTVSATADLAVREIPVPAERIRFDGIAVSLELEPADVDAGVDTKFDLAWATLVPAGDDAGERARARREFHRELEEGARFWLLPGQASEVAFYVFANDVLHLGAAADEAARIGLAVDGVERDSRAFTETIEIEPGLASEHTVELSDLAGRRARVRLYVPRECGAVTVERASVVMDRRLRDVVFIVVDTLRADHAGSNESLSTPALDRLARDGVRFEAAFAHASMTLPAHTSLFSSRYPHVTGVLVNGADVGPEVPLLADWLRENGYHTTGVASLATL